MTIDRNNMFLFPMESSLYVFVMYIGGYPLIKLDHVLTLAISGAGYLPNYLWVIF